MRKFLALALLPLLLAGCGSHPAAPASVRAAGPLAAKGSPEAEGLLTITGTVTGRIEKANGDVGAIAVDAPGGERTVYLTEKTALAWDPRVKAVRAPSARLDLQAGVRVEVLAVEEKSTGWGPATWLRAKSVVVMVGG